MFDWQSPNRGWAAYDLAYFMAGNVTVEQRRASEEHGTPAETITREKARRVARAAEDWAQRNGALERSLRFDVVAVTLADGRHTFELIRAAFDADGDTRLW